MEYPKSIIKAIHEVMGKVGYVQRKDVNQFHKYKYAGESALLEVLRPAMLEAGLILLPSGKSIEPIDEFGNTHITMEYTLAHTDGSVWPEKLCSFGAGGDKNSKGGVGDKGTYKAITGAGKYMLFKLFLIETGDDPENYGGKTPNSKTTPKDTTKAGIDDLPLGGGYDDRPPPDGLKIDKGKAKVLFAKWKNIPNYTDEEKNELLAEWGIESLYAIDASEFEKYKTLLEGFYPKN